MPTSAYWLLHVCAVAVCHWRYVSSREPQSERLPLIAHVHKQPLITTFDCSNSVVRMFLAMCKFKSNAFTFRCEIELKIKSSNNAFPFALLSSRIVCVSFIFYCCSYHLCRPKMDFRCLYQIQITMMRALMKWALALLHNFCDFRAFDLPNELDSVTSLDAGILLNVQPLSANHHIQIEKYEFYIEWRAFIVMRDPGLYDAIV